MEPIKMQNPIVEIDGDEMTRILWAMIKDELIRPFVDLNTEYYDLCLPNRDATDDQITLQAAEAIKRLARGGEVRHHHPQPPADGGVSPEEDVEISQRHHPGRPGRHGVPAPILISKVRPVVSCWKKPITIARHAYGDIYKAVGVPGPRPRQGRTGLHRRERQGALPPDHL